MSEAQLEVVVESVVGEEVKVETPAVSEVEQKALEMGWRPKTEFDGDETEFIDAQEFVRRKPLFDKIDSLRREQKETAKALKALQVHHEKVKVAEYNHALETLRAEKKVALEEGDADKLIEIDDKILDIKTARQVQANQPAVQQGPHPNFVSWTNQNKWYMENAELHAAADQIGTAYGAANPDEDPDKILEYVSKRIRKLYPEQFTNPNKTRTSAVEGSSSNKPAGKTSSSDDVELTDDERKAMNTFIRQGILTKDQYLADIKNLRGR